MINWGHEELEGVLQGSRYDCFLVRIWLGFGRLLNGFYRSLNDDYDLGGGRFLFRRWRRGGLNLVEEEIETARGLAFFCRRGFPDQAGTAVRQVGLLRIGSLGRVRSRCWVGFGW